MLNIKNTKPFQKLTRVWGSTNSVRTADSYAEYLGAAVARGDGRSPVSLANLVTCSMGGWRSVPSQTEASHIALNCIHTRTHTNHPIPHWGAPTCVMFQYKSLAKTPSKELINCNASSSKSSQITIWTLSREGVRPEFLIPCSENCWSSTFGSN